MSDKERQKLINQNREKRVEKITYLVKQFKEQFYNNSLGEIGKIFDNLENEILDELNWL